MFSVKNITEQVIGSVITALILGVSAIVLTHMGVNIYIICAIIFPAAIIGGVAAYKIYSRYRPAIPPIDPDFLILEKELIYRYHDGDKQRLSYEKRIKLKALKNHIECFEDKYRWTGNGGIQIQSKIKNQQFTETKHKNVWHYYEIRFPRPLRKNEIIETHLYFDLVDGRSATPFFSTSIEHPTKHLRLQLELAKELNVEEAVCEIASSLGAKRLIDSDIRKIDHGKLIWEIPKPKLLYYYEVRWDFPHVEA